MRRITLLMLIAHAAFGLAQDAYLNTAFVPRYWKANDPWPLSARVRNASSTVPLITFRVDWRFNSGPVQVGNTQSTTGILPGQYWPYTHPTAFNVPASSGTLKMWVVGVGDSNHSNDTLYFTVDVLSAWATKSVLIEQYTGTWCQFCPLPNAATNTLNDDPLIVVAKHHNGDELSSASSTAYWQQFNANYSPAGVMEQEEFGTLGDDAAYDQWGPRAEQRKQGVSPVSIAVASGFNAWQRLLTVDLAVTFTAAQTGTFVVNAYILEDSINGVQVAGGSPYMHQQVVREVLGGANGTADVIPATTTAGSTYSHQYTFTVPEQWNAANLRVIAMVTEKRNGTSWTVNVSDGDLTEVHVPESATAEGFFRLWPSPARDMAFIDFEPSVGSAQLQLIGADGRVVLEQTIQSSAGRVSLPIPPDCATGSYLLRAIAGDRVGTRTLVIE
ncbi:MAG: Omp28-related outer membrane protein [Flavobacteriales bacterium]|nr:Omp28-related outer membrane protein [Flavobacteriales bacterium]